MFFVLLILISCATLVACTVWLHWRAIQDGAIHDALLFLTGVSVLSYVCSRWDRAKRPVTGIFGASALLAIGAIASSTIGEASHELSPDELASALKPLILQEWEKQPGFENATIERISLTHQGGGLYSGSIEGTIDGRPQHFVLEGKVGRETISWEIKPQEK